MAGPAEEGDALYRTDRVLHRQVRVRYPLQDGRIVLRTELDWERDVEPTAISGDGTTFTFDVEAKRPFLYFKACWKRGEDTVWAVGGNGLLLMTGRPTRDVYPYFSGSEKGSFSPIIAIESSILGRQHLLRAYLPPGYHENTLKHYPVLFMQDGKNLFFPDEAFLGRDWDVDGSLELLDTMNATDKVVVLGIHSADRMTEYTKPGYEAYGRALVEEIVPVAKRRLRLIGERAETAVAGSSLGGVVSFYLAWQWPKVFAAAACLSSTFSHRDDLIERVLNEPKSPAKYYLDSGWPGDNYEVTLAMALALQSRGYVPGVDFLQLAFPLHKHAEADWAERLHLPLQLFWGRVSMAVRGRDT
jgi:predicted alpha/beta superfamily hydrolase